MEPSSAPMTSQAKRSAIPGVVETGLSRNLPERLKILHQVRQLRRSGVFDKDWYLRTYDDVAKAGVNPERHFVMYGAREGRSPNPNWFKK